MGLLIAFTFSEAASRFDARRMLIIQEANAIGTAYLRLDALPAAARPALREKFRLYLDARLAAFQMLPDLKRATTELRRAAGLQRDIWAQAVAAAEQGSPATMMLVLPALNEMIDIAATRTLASQMHPPAIVHVMLCVSVLACSLLAGEAMAASKARNRLHVIAFALLLTVTVFVILDLEYPRIGTIRINDWDRVLVEVREGMN